MTDDIEDFCSLWDQAQKSNTEFKPKKTVKAIEKPQEMPNFNEDEFEHDDPYFNYMNHGPESLLQESVDKNEKKKNLTGNPVRKWTLGKDSNPKIWVDEESLAEIEKLKRKLYEIECKLAATNGGGTKWHKKAVKPKDKDFLSKIEKLKKEIDKLSNSLGLSYEPSQSLYDEK